MPQTTAYFSRTPFGYHLLMCYTDVRTVISECRQVENTLPCTEVCRQAGETQGSEHERVLAAAFQMGWGPGRPSSPETQEVVCLPIFLIENLEYEWLELKNN